MKVRIDENAYFYANDRAYTFRFLRYKTDGSGSQEPVRFAKLSGQSISVENISEGDQIPNLTQWTCVEFVLNARAGVGIYRIGGAEGTFTFDPNGELLGFQFAANSTATGLYIDDLSVVDKAPETVVKTYTASVTWDDAHDYNGIRPTSLELTLGGETVTVNEASQWQADFTLPAFNADGSESSYMPSASADGYTANSDGLSVILSYTPVLYATDKDGVPTTAYFYNDFEGYYDADGSVRSNPVNHFYTGAQIRQLDTPMTLTYDSENNNSYLRILNKLESSASHYQADMQGYTGGNFTVHFKLRTDSDLAPENFVLEYRNQENGTAGEKNITLLKTAKKSNEIHLYARDKSNNNYDLAQIANEWVCVHAVFRFSDDGQSDQCDLYIGGILQKTVNLPTRLSTYHTSYIRLMLNQTSANAGRSLLLDDFIVYPGTDILSTDNVKSPGYYFTETAIEGEDVIGVAMWEKENVTVDPDVLAQAVNTSDITWPDTRPKTNEAMNSALALYHMVLSVHMDEDVTADGVVVANEAADRIKLLVSGGREPWASVGSNWGHGVVASTMALAKNTPAIWNQLSADDIRRVDLLMECLAIAANWGYNAENDYKTGFELTGEFSKTYNANFLNSYLTAYLSAAMYFDANGDGNGEELDGIFEAFDYDSYIIRLKAAGFTNILFTWTTVDEYGGHENIGYYMENGGTVTLNNVAVTQGLTPGVSAGSGVGVKTAFTYLSQIDGTEYNSSQLTEIFIDSIKYTYKWAVTSSHNSPDDFDVTFDTAYAYVLSDETNPWQGQMGMMSEYAAYNRSRSTYCYLSAVNIAPLYANMKLLDYWDYNPENLDLMRQMDNRIYVGTEDLFWKMDQGYYSISTTGSGPEYWSDFATSLGGIFVKDIFFNFHFAKNAEITWEPVEVQSVLEEAAPVDPNYTGPADDAIYAQGNYMSGYNVESNYVYLFEDKSASSNVKVSFDLVINDGLIPNSFKAHIMLDKAGSGRTYKNAPVVLYLHDGLIKTSYKNDYWSTFARFGENYRYHVDIEVDCLNKVYNISIQQIWPTVDGESDVVFYRENFASNHYAAETTEIDSIIVMSSYLQRCIWLENLTTEKVEVITEQ